MMLILCMSTFICYYYYTEHDAYVIHTQYSCLYEQLYLLIIITCYLLLLNVESASPSILDSVNTHVYYTHLSTPTPPLTLTPNLSQNSDPKSGIVPGRNPNLSPPVYEQSELGENSLLMQVCDVYDEEGVMRPTYILKDIIVQ